MRNPLGFGNYIKDINQIEATLASLEQINLEKWSGLYAMDSFLQETYFNSKHEMSKNSLNDSLKSRRK